MLWGNQLAIGAGLFKYWAESLLAFILDMIIGITNWEGRVSPVMDTATNLTVLELENGIESARREVRITDKDPFGKVERIIRSGTKVIICGAISRRLEDVLAGNGIQVISWIRGDIEAVVKAYSNGTLMDSIHLLPGCVREGRRMKMRKERKGGKGQRRMNRRG